MQIVDSSLSMSSSYSKVLYTEVRERLEIHRPGERSPALEDGFGPRSTARRNALMPEGLRGLDGPKQSSRACNCDHVHAGDDAFDKLEPKLQAALRLIEKLTGMKFDLLDTHDLQQRMDEAGKTPVPPPTSGATSGRAPQPTIIYDRVETRVESQSLRVAARAKVTTGDGRSIDVDLRLDMDRLFAERAQTHVRIGPPLKDPLVLDLGSGPGGIDGSQKVAFDLDADGNLDEVPWVTGGSAFLAVDRDDDGTIGDGSELFGARTGDGFVELAELDEDGDGWIDEDDAAWEQLRLVASRPAGEGIAVSATQSLREAGVGAIAVSAVTAPLTERDADGDVVAEQRDAGIYLRESGTAGTVRQIDLAF